MLDKHGSAGTGDISPAAIVPLVLLYGLLVRLWRGLMLSETWLYAVVVLMALGAAAALAAAFLHYQGLKRRVVVEQD